jgi:hypothetical protein
MIVMAIHTLLTQIVMESERRQDITKEELLMKMAIILLQKLHKMALQAMA